MRILSILLFTFFLTFISCQEDFELDEKNPNSETSLFAASSRQEKISSTNNEEILIPAILNTQWRDFNSIVDMSDDDIRNTLIVELNIKTSESISDLQAMSNLELSNYSLLYTLLKKASIRKPSELRHMSFEELRNTIIVENAKYLQNQNKRDLKKLPTEKLVQLGYSWYLPIEYNSLINYSDGKLSKIISPYKFKLKDNKGKSMDVLKIVKTNETSNNHFKYLGVYHIGTSNDNYNLQLAGSNDLFNWIHIIELDHDAHQGDIIKWGEGYLIAYEEDKQQGNNNIALKYYNNYCSLVSNMSIYSKSIQTSINSFGVEGTPDIRGVSGTSPTNGNIQIGFHYYDGNIDRLAMGILRNGNYWKAWKDALSEYNLREMNFKGNIGSRKSFRYGETDLTLQEARLIKGDWSTWKIMNSFKLFPF
ncbi:hypothetical protein [Zunongwangia pacifica]|uniref:Lipoprotein n=1 Tax=Zunongwangia pacifica TaxID=2911062 RepID=A0A9X1ZXG9_9FLAO|nr:hypothetical protein [Zunongwangia pacifica]MCL6220975.1 hypothetical protein [Zunongwangia pacifica]